MPFEPRDGDALPTIGVRSLTSARADGLWIVWRNGQVSRLRNGRLTAFGETDGLSKAFEVAESATGVVVAGSSSGVARFADGRWTDVRQAWGYPDTEGVAVWFDRAGALWVESESRVLILPAGSSRFVDAGMDEA